MKYACHLASEYQQLALATRLAKAVRPGSVIYLQGELGVGKTTLVRGFLQGLGYQGNVKSPTYTLVEPYQITGQRIYHFDLYRLADPEELEYAGGRDYFDGQAISLIEWPEKASGYLPPADLVCQLRHEPPGRALECESFSPKGDVLLQLLSN